MRSSGDSIDFLDASLVHKRLPDGDTAAPELQSGVVPLFTGVDSDLVHRITREMCRTYQQNEILCQEGAPAEHLFVILRGVASVDAGGEAIATRGAGSVIGEQAFIERTRRGATVTAVTQVDVLRIPHALVEDLLANRTFARNLLAVVSAKLSEATRDRAVRYRRERILFGEFRAHVSEDVAQRLLNSGLDYGRPRCVPAVVLFTDIRNFTSQCAALPPEDVAAQLTVYFDQVVDVIHAHSGMVDKFVGDAVMAVWGGFEPLTPEEMVERAFACAREIVRAAAAMAFGGRPIAVGVGLNFGDVFMGNVGGEGKRQFTVLGNTVNLAARYESQAKEVRAPVVIGPAFAALLRDEQRLALAVHPDIKLAGAEPQTLYTWNPTDARGKENRK